MKKIIFFTALYLQIMPTTNIFAQYGLVNPFPKTITVAGSSEMEIIPDRIFVNIQLKEYQRKGETKKDLEFIKQFFLDQCHALGLPDSLLSIVSYGGENSYNSLLRRKKKSPELLSAITYQVEFASSKLMDELVARLDDEATQRFDIVFATHSRITDFRKQVKTNAIVAAKEKAKYLAEALHEKIGVAVSIREPDEPLMRGNWYANMSNEMNSRSVDVLDPGPVDFKKIKLRYELHVVFALE